VHSIGYRGYDVNSLWPLSAIFFADCCYNAKNARDLRGLCLKIIFRKMPASLEDGPSNVLRLRVPPSLERRIKDSLRPGETFSEVARKLLEQWANRREKAGK